MPRRWYVWSYERALPLVYRVLGSSGSGIGSGLDQTHFFMTREIVDTTPGLFAVAREPPPLISARFRASGGSGPFQTGLP